MITNSDIKKKTKYVRFTPADDRLEDVFRGTPRFERPPKVLRCVGFERCWSYDTKEDQKCDYVLTHGCNEWVVVTKRTTFTCGCDWTACSDLDVIVNGDLEL